MWSDLEAAADSVSSLSRDPHHPGNRGKGATDRNMMITSKFGVEVDQIYLAYFRKLTGLEVTTAYDTVHEGGVNSHPHLLPTTTAMGTKIVLEKGIVVNDLLWAWYEEVIRGIIEPRTVSVHAFENIPSNNVRKERLVSYVLDGALPVGWKGPDFDANQDNRLVHQLTFICTGWRFAPPLTRLPAPNESPHNLGDM